MGMAMGMVRGQGTIAAWIVDLLVKGDGPLESQVCLFT